MIIGVTGHQDIGDEESIAWVRGALGQQLRFHCATLGLSSLAVGSDQLFAEVLIAADLPFEVVIPCVKYEDAFSDEQARSTYRRLLATARRAHCLPYDRPSEEAFFAAGKWIVSHCDLLLAVWDGLPAQGLGGTADVVAAAIHSHRAWVHIDPTQKRIRFSS